MTGVFLFSSISVADPGFPVGGGAWTSYRGGMDSRGGYVSKILYVKMKESGPLGGVCRVQPLDLPMNIVNSAQ